MPVGLHLLKRSISCRLNDRQRFSPGLFPGAPKINEKGRIPVDHQDIGRLDVPVKNISGMEISESSKQALQNHVHVTFRQALAAFNHEPGYGVQAISLNKRHHKIGRSIRSKCPDNLDDIGMVKGSQHPGFLQE